MVVSKGCSLRHALQRHALQAAEKRWNATERMVQARARALLRYLPDTESETLAAGLLQEFRLRSRIQVHLNHPFAKHASLPKPTRGRRCTPRTETTKASSDSISCVLIWQAVQEEMLFLTGGLQQAACLHKPKPFHAHQQLQAHVILCVHG